LVDVAPHDAPGPQESLPTPGSGRRRVWAAAKAAAAAGLIAYLLHSGRLDLSALSHVRPGRETAVLLGLVLIALLLPCVRWQWLLRYQGVEIRFLSAVQMTWVGYFFGLFLPGAASGDIVRGYYVAQGAPQARFQSVSTIIADRGLGLVSLFFLGLAPACLLFLRGEASPAVTAMGYTSALLAVGSVAAVALLACAPTRGLVLRLAPPRVRAVLDDCLARYRARPWGLAACFALSLLSNACNALAFAPAAQALGVPLPPSVSLLAGPLVILANSLPLSPGGIGVAESAASSLFGSLGVAHGATSMLLLRLVIMLCALPGAAVYVLRRPQTCRDS